MGFCKAEMWSCYKLMLDSQMESESKLLNKAGFVPGWAG